MDHHVEIAKLRAARQLWATALKARHGDALTNEKAFVLRTHVQTSGYSLTAQDPLNNVARTALEALAAVHGGAQSLHTNAFDEALALPSAGVGDLIYYWALGYASASKIAVFQYLQPPLAAAAGAVMLGEEVSVQLALAGLAIILGVSLAERG